MQPSLQCILSTKILQPHCLKKEFIYRSIIILLAYSSIASCLGGPATVVAADAALVKAQVTPLSLVLNEKKCETITTDGHTDEISLQKFIHHTPLFSTLLGAPLLQGPAMNDCLEKRYSDVERTISRLDLITSRDALVLLRASFSAPALQHTLLASPCNGHEALIQFYNILRIALCKICNVSLSDDQWLQASLPVKSGGLGIRHVTAVAPSAFIASAVGTRDQQNQILQYFAQMPDKVVEYYPQTWYDINVKPIPDGPSATKQRFWDNPVVEREFALLLQSQTDDYGKA